MTDPLVRQDETLDTLFHGKLHILQKKEGYRMSMEPVLLSHFASPISQGRIIDLGTGSGVIPMILKLKGVTGEITGLEVRADLVEMAKRSVKLNGMEESIRIALGDYGAISELFPAQSFDHVICNPPFHSTERGRISPESQKANAKHETMGSMNAVARASRYLLGTKGRLWLSYTPRRLTHLVSVLKQEGFEPKRLRMVHGRWDKPAGMLLLEAVRNGREGLDVMPPLVLYKEGNEYTEELDRIYGAIP